ncbi:hypothetical protein CMT19_04315 [Elizabethkingia anophelis]|nr:hypothetical protein [Elizabethkingia anophelis]
MNENNDLYDKLMSYKAAIRVLESDIQLRKIICYILIIVLIILLISILIPTIKKRVFGIRRRAYRLFSRVHKGYKIKNQQLKTKVSRLENRDRIVISIIIGVAFSLLLGVICGEKEYYSYFENKRISKETYNSINDEIVTYSKFNPSYILIICGFPFFSGIAYLALKQREVGDTNNTQ